VGGLFTFQVIDLVGRPLSKETIQGVSGLKFVQGQEPGYIAFGGRSFSRFEPGKDFLFDFDESASATFFPGLDLFVTVKSAEGEVLPRTKVTCFAREPS